MKIAFRKTDVKKGGTYEDLFYDRVLVEGRRIETMGGYVVVPDVEDVITYNWISNNIADIKYEGLVAYIELPAAMKDTLCPAWLPDRINIDENGEEYTKTLEQYGFSRERLDGTRWLFTVEVQPAFADNLFSFVLGNGQADGYTVKGARTLTQGVEYTESE
jgi:hypothetical protein